MAQELSSLLCRFENSAKFIENIIRFRSFFRLTQAKTSILQFQESSEVKSSPLHQLLTTFLGKQQLSVKSSQFMWFYKFIILKLLQCSVFRENPKINYCMEMQ